MRGEGMKSKMKKFFRNYGRTIIIWTLIFGFLLISIPLKWDKKMVAFLLFVFALLSQAFQSLIAFVNFIPHIGPHIARVLSLPLFWTLNGLAYLVTFSAMKVGNIKRAVESKVLVTAFLIGVIVGFIFGKII